MKVTCPRILVEIDGSSGSGLLTLAWWRTCAAPPGARLISPGCQLASMGPSSRHSNTCDSVLQVGNGTLAAGTADINKVPGQHHHLHGHVPVEREILHSAEHDSPQECCPCGYQYRGLSGGCRGSLLVPAIQTHIYKLHPGNNISDCPQQHHRCICKPSFHTYPYLASVSCSMQSKTVCSSSEPTRPPSQKHASKTPAHVASSPPSPATEVVA